MIRQPAGFNQRSRPQVSRSNFIFGGGRNSMVENDVPSPPKMKFEGLTCSARVSDPAETATEGLPRY
jgi:hypothetical protein